MVSAEEVAECLQYGDLIEKLRESFLNFTDFQVPPRHHHSIATAGECNATLLLMPAWTNKSTAGYMGVKLVTVFPENSKKNVPTVLGSYMLSSVSTGQPLAVIDGTELTLWRTACASALAADYLARKNPETLLMVGAGAMAPHLIKAHLTLHRTIRQVIIWNRNQSTAEILASKLSRECESSSFPKIDFQATFDLENSVRVSDIISCATSSSFPLVEGNWVKMGSHLDLVGSYKPSMREVDDKAVSISRIFVDTREGAMVEGGDLVDPLLRGIISDDDIIGDLSDLTGGKKIGRMNDKEITLFKSVGCALEDLVAATLVYEKMIGCNKVY